MILVNIFCLCIYYLYPLMLYFNSIHSKLGFFLNSHNAFIILLNLYTYIGLFYSLPKTVTFNMRSLFSFNISLTTNQSSSEAKIT